MASVTGKLKRGAAGKSNAEASPYRLNGGGLYPLYMRRILGPVLSRGIGKPPVTNYSKDGGETGENRDKTPFGGR